MELNAYRRARKMHDCKLACFAKRNEFTGKSSTKCSLLTYKSHVKKIAH